MEIPQAVRVGVLLLLLICPKRGSADYTFNFNGTATEANVALIKEAYEDGWKHVCKVIGSEDVEPPEFIQAGLADQPDLWVEMNSAAASAAWAHPFDKPGIIINYRVFSKYNRRNRGRVMAHEMLHYMFKLPDEYADAAMGRTVDKRDCVMGNFFNYGWSAKLCPECSAKVKAYYDVKRTKASDLTRKDFQAWRHPQACHVGRIGVRNDR